MIAFRHVDRRFPFLWETADQPPGRWHGEGEGPVHYFADTPDGAWAEFLRQEEITEPDDLAGVERGPWAVEIGERPRVRPRVRPAAFTSDATGYPVCRRAAARLRAAGAPGLVAPSAALLPGAAHGFVVDGGEVIVLFGRRPDLVGWPAAIGRPRPDLLTGVRHFGAG